MRRHDRWMEAVRPVNCANCGKRATIYVERTHFCVKHALELLDRLKELNMKDRMVTNVRNSV